MRRNRSIYRRALLALMAVLAASAVVSAAASAAAPEFVHCVAKTGGKFAAGCLTAGTTSEKEPVKAGVGKLKFTAAAGVVHLYGASASTISCQKDKINGEITGAKTVGNVKITLEECKGKKGTEECVINGGTLKLETLSGELGKVSKEEAVSEVGEDLKPPTEKPFVTFTATCLPDESIVGSVIGEVKPVKTLQTTGELIYACYSLQPPIQEIEKFEGGIKDTLSGFPLYGSEACLESKVGLTFEEPIEVT